MKKMLAAMLALMLMLSILVVAIAEEQVYTCGDYDYSIKEDGTAVIVKYHGDGNSDITVPGELDGYVVSTIGVESFSGDNITYSQDAGITITLPESITTIEDRAFWGRTIRSINIPDGVTHIGYGVFVYTSRTVGIIISNNHPCFAIIDGSLYNKQHKELLYYYGTANKAGNYNIELPEGITSIGDYAFYGYASEERDQCCIIIGQFPSTLNSIGNYAFYGTDILNTLKYTTQAGNIGCYAFAETNFQNKVHISSETISDYAFFGSYVSSDSKIGFELAEGVREIGAYAFSQTTAETSYPRDSITIPASVERIGIGCFENSALNIKFSENSKLTEIPEYAFSGCGIGTSYSVDENGNYEVSIADFNAYTGVWLPSQSAITCIKEYAFKDANIFDAYDVFKNEITIEGNAFFHASFFTVGSYNKNVPVYDIPIPSSCTTIPDGAFYTLVGWPVLQDGVQVIRSKAFRKVEDFYLPSTLTEIDSDAFAQGSTFVVETGSYAESWARENGFYCTVNGEEQDLDWLNN